jgi:DNA-binding beta-propeller fold protein YncE
MGSPAAALGEEKPSDGGSSTSSPEPSLAGLGVQVLEPGPQLQAGENITGSSPEEAKVSNPAAASPPEERTKVGEASGEGSALPSPFEGQLMVPGALGSEEALRVQAAEEAKQAEEAERNSPEAVSLREASRTKFENLNTEQAGKVAGEAFPGLVNTPAGGPPRLPAGQEIVGFPSDSIAQVDLGGGKHGVIEATEPMAVQSSSGRRTPIDLSLSQVGDVFEPATPAVGVSIPKRLSAGVELPVLNVSLTPVDAHGSPLGGSEGALTGSGVMYANTQTDSDTLVKPTTAGFEADTLLRSVESPGQLYFRVGLPEGASLVQSQTAPGLVKVMVEGAAVAMIRPPSARDVAGASVPVSMSVNGDLLALTVASHSGEYQWPISVDPELAKIKDNTISEASNWHVQAEQETKFKHFWASNTVEQYNLGSNSPGEFTQAAYYTQGESKIYRVEAQSAGTVSKGRAKLQLVHAGAVEQTATIAENSSWGSTVTTVCANTECSTAGGGRENAAWFRLEAIEPATETYSVSGSLWNTHVYIAQEKAPEPTFNESEATLSDGRANALDGCHCTGGKEPWLGPYSNTAIEAKAHDPGIGVSWARLGSGSWSLWEPIWEEGKCAGVQCNENYHVLATYNPAMPEGEQGLEWFAANLAGRIEGCESCNGLVAEETQLVKVDATPPHNLEVTGWPANREISAAPHVLTIAATDSSTYSENHSSGVKSIAVSIDGGAETTVAGASCSLGTCTASGKYTLNAEALSEGVHRLVVTATDNASNPAPAKEFTFNVRHASPVSVGPGTVDPSTGQFKLGATDVSLAGAGGVSRVYQSRSLAAGVEGPLGPQWAISLGGGEGLAVLSNGSVVLTGSAGGHTTFTRNEKGEFESPKGDSNLKVEATEKEKGKGITEYLLIDATAGTSTRFTQPPGTQLTTPAFLNQFGAEAAQLSHPLSDSVDASGNVWVTDNGNNRIEKFSPGGALVAAYGSYGSGSGQFSGPWGIAVNQSNGNVYVTDQANYRVEELSSSGSFIRSFGSQGTGNGQFSTLAGVAVDSSGNVWVADYGNNRIQEFNEKGEYKQKFGSEGTGNSQFKGPLNIAFSGGNLYVTDYGNNRVQEFSTAGAYVSQFGSSGSGNGQFLNPYGIAGDPISGNLYVVDNGHTRVQEFSPAGAFITKFGSSGTGAGQFVSPTGVAVNASGGVYVEDYSANRVEEWTRPAWLPTLAEGPLKSGTTSYAYGAVEVEGKTVIEPTEALAPAPPGVSCGTKPEELKEASKKGCRGLTFNYAETTTATGENATQWGDYKGHLTRVYFHAWDPSKGAMTEPIVAQYEYDTKGRLRAEWDPRISPAVKTMYGYDAEGHLTALTPPGQESWAFTYGTMAGDSNPGRMLKVTRAPAAAKLWKGEPPKNTEAPKLAGSPVVGVAMGVSSGIWSNEPLAYSYQWEDCNSGGAECSPILGATNANYNVVSSDVGHTLVAQVGAINGGGTVVAVSAASSEVVLVAGELTEYHLPAGSGPQSIVTGPDKNLWFVDHATSKIGKITAAGTVSEYALPTGSAPTGVAAGPDGNVWFTDFSTSRIGRITTAGTVSEYALPAGSKPWNIAPGPDGELWYTDAGTNKIGKIATTGTITAEYSLPAGSEPTGIVTGPDKNLWFTDNGSNKIGKSTTAGTITEYALPAGSGPAAIASGPDGNLWFTDYKGNKIGKITTGGAITEYVLPAGSYPWGITAEPHGNIAFAEYNNSKIGTSTTSGTITQYSLPASTGPYGITVGPDENLWFAENLSSHIGKINLHSEGEHNSPGPGTTIEYHVPISGTGLPTLTESEVGKWGQKDYPTEGVAIFPPDEPQGWPATSYKRATIHYWDASGRTVNTKVPSGGIATSEYNETNDVVRTLSADNRATALKEGTKSAEVSKTLDTQSTYNTEGTQLESTLGPEHQIKLTSGTEVKARAHVKYFYDEGAPAEYAHDGLVTKTTDGAQYSGKEEDIRTTTTSFSGQENLGWKLRKPTSVTTDPSGLKLTSTTVYEPLTGNVVETQTPAAAGGDAMVPPAYSLAFGAKGSAGGQFEGPEHDALDSSGNVWVADYANHRIQKLSPSGTFMLAVGWGVKDGKAEPETCTASCRAGVSGSGNGQFEGPFGIAVNQTSGNVYVSDYLGNRIEELSSTGTFVAAFGSKGTGGGQYTSPEGIAIDSSGNVWASDSGSNRIQELSSTGTFTLAVGWGVKDAKAEAETCTVSCQAGIAGSGNGQMSSPTGVGFSGSNVYVSDYGNNRVDEFSATGAYVSKFGAKGSGTGQFEGPSDIATESTGSNLYVVDSGNNRVEKFSSAGTYLLTFGSKGSGNGQLLLPAGVVVNSSGVYVSDHNNNRIEKWIPAITGNAGAHKIETIYYTGAANSEYPACGGHVEWENLLCETKPVAQPGTASLPELPVITMTYNVWDEVEVTTETFGSTKRTKTQTYDTAGRALTSEETSTVDTGLPKVTNKYSTATGVVEAQSTTVGETTKTLRTEANTLGQMTSYTDADGSTTTYEYESGQDERLTKMSYKIGTEGFSQKYSYDETTGSMSELVDSAAGSDPSVGRFTATYDVEGKMLTEGYPNGMTAAYTVSPLGQAIGLEYVKTTHCTEKCTWFSDSVSPSIHGETLAQTSTLAKDSYAYDKAGRLTETQETPTGKGCATRLYAYDEEANRTALTKRESGTETCATEGGSTEWHTYDTANRPTDAGVTYETFGNATKLPASDAGEHEITSSYYVDGQVASQTQNEETVNNYYDPAGRTRETVSAGKTASTVISHYAGTGNALTWTTEGAEKWTRNVPGIDGALGAIQTNGGTPVLQLDDLGGDIVATAALSETETKLLSTYNSTEFGVPQPGTTPPKYAWLGAGGVASEPSFAAGTVTQGGASYVPEVARNLQTAPVVPPGAFPNGTGTGSVYTSVIPGWATAVSNGESAATLAEYAAKLEAARRKAEQEALETAERIHGEEEAWPSPTEGGAEGEAVDPQVRYMLSAWGTKLLVHALTVGGAAASQLLGKWFGPEAGVAGQLISTFAGEAVTGLNECLTAYYNSGQPTGYRCAVRLEWWDLPGPPYILPISAEFEDCFYDAKKKSRYDCYDAYSISWENLF